MMSKSGSTTLPDCAHKRLDLQILLDHLAKYINLLTVLVNARCRSHKDEGFRLEHNDSFIFFVPDLYPSQAIWALLD